MFQKVFSLISVHKAKTVLILLCILLAGVATVGVCVLPGMLNSGNQGGAPPVSTTSYNDIIPFVTFAPPTLDAATTTGPFTSFDSPAETSVPSSSEAPFVSTAPATFVPATTAPPTTTQVPPATTKAPPATKDAKPVPTTAKKTQYVGPKHPTSGIPWDGKTKADPETGISWDGVSPIIYTYEDGSTGTEKKTGARYERNPFSSLTVTDGMFEAPDNPGVCPHCGRVGKDGSNGTCLRYIGNSGHDCPNCGVFVEPKTCHTCKD